MDEDGYLVVLTGNALLDRYSRFVVPSLLESGGKPGALADFWRIVDVDPPRYRGMGRWPLPPYPSLDPDVIQQFRELHVEMDENRAARMKLCELVDERSDDYEDALPESIEQARDVWRLLDSPSEWEIIRVTRAPVERTVQTLGYDIGWWGGKFYSLIGDSVVTPTWHPPTEEDYDELAIQVQALNDHLLFESPEAALKFRSWYTSKRWAETENGIEFVPVRIDEGVSQ
jgi:hypothetical protein